MPHRTPRRPSLLRAAQAVLALLALTLGAVAVPPAAPAQADDGTTLRSFRAEVPSCGVSVGVAFDGTDLFVSCYSTSQLYGISPADGKATRTITVEGVSGLGALAYDRGRGAFWACTYPQEDVVLITVDDAGHGKAEKVFHPVDGCFDGLAFDGTDQTLFTSGDVSRTVYHYRPDGSVIDTRYVGGSLGGCGNSGIAVGGQQLFLANNGCSQIYRADKTDNALPQLFATYPERLEDLECDDVTFRSQGKAAIWSKDAYDPVINAFELNIGDCGFGGQPSPVGGDKFVYVALGDSYQSGEGVGNSLASTSDYLNLAYENGSNYSRSVGAQQDTYSATLGGNSCHRSLANYAKINRDKLAPGSDVVLVDVTCSGAMIEPGGKPAVVGTSGSPDVTADSQVSQALAQLAGAGLTAGDVDLVTVGMGGNDAKFGLIVASCLAPNLVRRLLKEYPDSPGEIEFIANQFATCELADNQLFKTQPAIDALAGKETWAQGKLLEKFPTARILQLNYPDILPAKKSAPSWCGGIRKEDLDYAKGKISQIDAIVEKTAEASGKAGRYEHVDVKTAFGSNGLCPASAEATLANGLNEANFDKELRRLLDLDGNGDAHARRLLDALVTSYTQYKSCLAEHYNPFGGDCDTDAALTRLRTSGQTLLTYLQQQQETIQANVIQPPGAGSESRDVRVDRTRGLFHPNANGFAVMACHVRGAYNDAGTGGCLSSTSPVSDTANGAPLQNAPIPGGSGVEIHIQIGGFEINARIRITLFSTPVELGTAVADANGVIDTVVKLPAAAPGVHTLEVQGDAPGGNGIHKRLRVAYDGRPSGGTSYSTYLCCFGPATEADGTTTERVDILFKGSVLDTLTPDEDGGVFAQIPVLDLVNAPGPMTITAKSRTSGRTVITTIDPVASVAGLWAASTAPGALSVTGNGQAVSGLVHSNADIAISGTGTTLAAGAEHATSLSVTGSRHHVPSPRKVAAGGSPAVSDVADYRPGGRLARMAGSSYRAVPASSCVDGLWTATATQVPAGTVYVPCAVALTGQGHVNARIVAEGAITVSGSSLTVAPPTAGSPSLLTAAKGSNAVRVSGSNVRLIGTLQALAGNIRVDGSNNTFHCGIVANMISLAGGSNRVQVDDTCRSS